MKICIITVYDSINSGSYLQAYALGKKCELLGHEVYYLKRTLKYRIKLKLNHFNKAIKILIKKGFVAYIYKIKIDKHFRKLQNNLKTVTKKRMTEIDCIIIGSDTLWNINASYLKKNYRLFFGGEFKDKKSITYAISSANVKKEEIMQLPNIKKYVNNLFSISVRDSATKEIAENLSNKPVELVCDPTLLISKNDYNDWIDKRKEEKKYIFLYLFEDLNKYQIENIKRLSKEKNLIIVDGVLNRNWADKSVMNVPNNFLNYMYFADYIITDTFHGTIFSISFNKQFVSIERKKNKVKELLYTCDLNDRLSGQNNLSSILQERIDYKKVNQKLDNYRGKSTEYLKRILKNK